MNSTLQSIRVALVSAVLLLPTLAIAQSTTTTESSTTTVATTSIIITNSATTTATTTVTIATTTVTTPDYRNPAVVEAKVRSFFSEIPVMISIALCESRFKQFDSTGAPLNGGGGGMIGIFQINRAVHKAFALMLGFDIDSVEGNIGYAKYLYGKEGTNPWIDSFPCWNVATNNPEVTTQVTSTPSTPSGSLTTNLSFGMIHPQVLLLQQLLNKLGYVISPDGAGSPGNETTKFGSLTRVSIRKFQCANNIVCTGDEGSTGYGYVGARTRAALLGASPIASTGNTTTNTTTQPPAQTNERAAKILSLQAQIDQYMKTVNDLKAQVEALKAQ